MSNKAFLALVRKQRLQRREPVRTPFDDVDAKAAKQRAELRALQQRQGERGGLDTSKLHRLLDGALEGLSEEVGLRRELVALDREALEIERERAKLVSPWWVRLLRWIATKV